MAFDNPPFVMDATTVDGEVIRRAIGSLIGSTGGVVTGGDCQVTQNGTPNMTVNIGLGQIWVPGSTTTTQGPYYSRNGGSISQAINAANATNPRIDTVGVQVQDKAYAGSLTQIAPFYVAGTATAGANLTNLTGKGTVPASSYVLAYVLVPASATSIVTADILNVATVVGLGPPPLSPRVPPGSATMVEGTQNYALAGTTQTLPAPFVGATVGVTAASGVSGGNPVTIAYGSGGGGIYGVGLGNPSANFLLGAAEASVGLQSPDGLNWVIISGQQDTGWVAISLPTGWTTSTISNVAPAIRLIGDRCWLRGGAHNGKGTNTGFSFTLSAPFDPVNEIVTSLTSNVLSQAYSLSVSAASGGSSSATVSQILTGNDVFFDGANYCVA